MLKKCLLFVLILSATFTSCEKNDVILEESSPVKLRSSEELSENILFCMDITDFIPFRVTINFIVNVDGSYRSETYYRDFNGSKNWTVGMITRQKPHGIITSSSITITYQGGRGSMTFYDVFAPNHRYEGTATDPGFYTAKVVQRRRENPAVYNLTSFYLDFYPIQ